MEWQSCQDVENFVALVDYDAGNLHSAAKALEAAGLRVKVTSNPVEVAFAPAVVLPGVGAFGDCLEKLRERNLLEPVRLAALEAAGGGRPFLGICVGMQILFEWGEEGQGQPGLGVLPGRVVRLDQAVRAGLKVPHMGWNQLRFTSGSAPGSALFRGLPDGSHVYFVHSYHALCGKEAHVLATCDYGGPVTAAVGQGSLVGVQFHPEKSSRTGLHILRNFGEMVHAYLSCD